MTTRNLIVSIAGGLGLLVILWLALRDDGERPAAPKATASARPASPAAAIADSEPTPRGRLRAAQAKLRGATDDACGLPADAVARRVAGAEPKQAEAMKSIEISAAFRRFQAGLRDIDASLRASPDPYANAVAIWLNLPRGETDDGAVPEAERRRQLAAMAVSTTDPRLYVLAFHACRHSAEDGCQALSARRWAQLDAGNAEPWVYLFDEAVRKNDLSGQQEALFRMATAARIDQRNFAPASAIVAASNDSDADPMAAYALSEMSLGMTAAQVEPMFTTSVHCRKAAAKVDANDTQLCLKIADLMFEHSDEPATRLGGAVMTARLTGDASRKDLAGAELNAWIEQFKTPPATCDQLRRNTALFARMATLGPQATLRSTSALAATP